MNNGMMAIEAGAALSRRHRHEPRHPRILLAEDDLEMRRLLAWALEREGFTVEQCHDGYGLRKSLEHNRTAGPEEAYDLVISDIRMPGPNGLEVLREAAARPGAAPMILISAFCDDATLDLARRLGAAGLLPKPFDTEELVAHINRLLPPRERRAGTPHQPHSDSEGDGDFAGAGFPLEIVFRNHEGSASVRDHIQRLAGRLRRSSDAIESCFAEIESYRGDAGAPQRYRLTVIVATVGKPIVVEHDTGRREGSEDLYAALHFVFAVAGSRLDAEAVARKARRDATPKG